MLLGIFLFSAAAEAGSWTEKVKLKGDFRFRHETIQQELKEVDRHRWRLRFRLATDVTLTDDWSMHARLITGGDDPLSANQTLSEGFSTKDYGLDRAYLDYHPGAVKGLNVIFGKFYRPLYVPQKTELIWDGDLSPGGIAAQYKVKASDNLKVFANGVGFYVEERKQADDTRMFGGQLGFNIKASEQAYFVVGGGYYAYENLKGNEGLYVPGDFFGNTSVKVEVDGDSIDVYAYDYRMVDAFVEFGVKLEKVTIIVIGNFVQNTEPDEHNQGYLAGAMLKHGKGKGNWKLFGYWRELQADAVIGAFTDSDFGGGGTDNKGFEIGAGYGIADKVDLGFAAFINKLGIEEELDYKRFQLDLKAKF
jgi:hypothetical protein